MPRLELIFDGKNTVLRGIIKEIQTDLEKLEASAKNLNVNIGSKETVKDTRAVSTALQEEYLSLARLKTANQALQNSNAQLKNSTQQLISELQKEKIATEQARTAAQQAIAAAREYALSQRKAKDGTAAAAGSYKEAQQRLTAMGKAIREAGNGFQSKLSPETKKAIADYRKLNEELKKFDALMGNNQRKVGDYSGALGGAINSIKGLILSYVSLFAIVQGGQKILDLNAKISDTLADVQRTAGLSQREARGLYDELKKLGTRTSLESLTDIAVIGGQLGIAREELVGFTEALDVLAVVLSNEIPGGADAVATSLGKINGVFKVAESEGLTAGQAMSKTGSAILALGQSGLATGEFLVDFTQRVAGVARVTGIALPTMLAYGAVLEEAGVSAEVAGTALAKLIGNLAGKRNEFFAIAKMADATLTIEQFTELINTDAEAALRKFFKGLKAGGQTTTEFYDILKTAQINTERYRNAVLLLATDQDKLAGKVALSTDEFKKGTLAAEQFAVKNNTLGASLDKMYKSFISLTTGGGFADLFKGAADSVTNWANALNRLVSSSSWTELTDALFDYSTFNLFKAKPLPSNKMIGNATKAFPGTTNVGKDGLFGSKPGTSPVDNKQVKESIGLIKQLQDAIKALEDERPDITNRKDLSENIRQTAAYQKQLDELNGKEVKAKKKVVDETAKILKDSNSRTAKAGLEGRALELEGIRQFYSDRLAQVKKGSTAYNQLQANQRAEIAAVNKDWDAKDLKKLQETQKKYREFFEKGTKELLEVEADKRKFSLQFQRRLNESLTQAQLRQVNDEYKLLQDQANKEYKARILKGENIQKIEKEIADKRAKLQEQLFDKIEAIEARDREMKVSLAFDGNAFSMPLEAINQKIQELRRGFEAGSISAEKFKESITKFELQQAQLSLLKESVDGISGSFGNLFGDILFNGKDALQNFADTFQGVIENAISGLAKLGVQYLINQAISKSGLLASTVASKAAGAATASAWAPAASLASTATFGAAAIAGQTALLASMAATRAIALTGFSQGGYTGNMGRSRVAGVVHGQEYVINADAARRNMGLLKSINEGRTPTVSGAGISTSGNGVVITPAISLEMGKLVFYIEQQQKLNARNG